MRFAPALQVCPIHERALKREVLVTRAHCNAFRRSDMFDIMCVGGLLVNLMPQSCGEPCNICMMFHYPRVLSMSPRYYPWARC